MSAEDDKCFSSAIICLQYMKNPFQKSSDLKCSINLKKKCITITLTSLLEALNSKDDLLFF